MFQNYDNYVRNLDRKSMFLYRNKQTPHPIVWSFNFGYAHS